MSDEAAVASEVSASGELSESSERRSMNGSTFDRCVENLASLRERFESSLSASLDHWSSRATASSVPRNGAKIGGGRVDCVWVRLSVIGSSAAAMPGMRSPKRAAPAKAHRFLWLDRALSNLTHLIVAKPSPAREGSEAADWVSRPHFGPVFELGCEGKGGGSAPQSLTYPPCYSSRYTVPKTRLLHRPLLSLLILSVGFAPAMACAPKAVDTPPVAPPTEPPVVAEPVDDTLAPRLEKLASALEQARVDNHVVGMAVAVVKDGGVVFARGFGETNLESKTPVTPRTMFAIGSSTKAFTATLIGMLVDDGKMTWDDPIEQHVPEFTLAVQGKDVGKATIRDALSHRTGFTRMGVLWASGKVPRPEFLAQASHAKPTADLGKKFQYNNVTYAAAGEASARVAELSWDELLKQRLLDPLGMKDSTSSSKEALANERLATGYRWREIPETFEAVPMRPIDQIGPAGAINSNVLDMTRWLRFQLANGTFEGERLIAKETLLAMRDKQIDVGGKMAYGMGWFLDEWNGEKLYHHGGNIDGYAAMVAILPGRNTGLVMLTNVSYTPLQGGVAELVFDNLFGEEEAAEASEEDLSVLIGDYVATFGQFDGQKFAVTEKDGKLFVDVPGQKNFELKPPGEDGHREFALTSTIAVSFEKSEDGKTNTMRLHQAGFDFELFREGYVPPAELPLADLEKHLGFYENKTLGKAEVKVRNNRLAIDIPKQMVYDLHKPDESGKWAFRIKPDIAIAFEPANAPKKIILHQGGKTFDFLRVGSAKTKGLPSVEKVLAPAKIGKTERALAKLGVVEMSGEADFIQAGVKGTFKFVHAPDGRSSFSLDIGRYGKMHTVVYPDRGWEWTNFGPLDPLEGKYLEQAALIHLLSWSRDWTKVLDVTVQAQSKFRGEPSWELRGAKGKLPQFKIVVDAATGDVRRVRYSVLTPAGQIGATELLSDYRNVEGMRVPHRIERRTGPSGSIVLEVKSVGRYEGSIDDAFPSAPPPSAK